MKLTMDKPAISREAAEFLPAVLEVQETPPLPAARWILWAIIGCFVAALTWSVWAQVDVVAVAPGKVIPAGKVKTIQAFETGRVRTIHIKDGQRVAQGELLIELDPSVSVADVNATKQRIAKLEKTLPIAQERADGAGKLNAQGLIPRSDYLALEEQRIAVEQDLAAAQQELLKVQERVAWQNITAPVTGIVQQLAVHGVGAVVSSAEPLMVIVPEGQRMEIEALVANQDRGFVWPGQETVVKIDSFPFTRYGALSGRLTGISEDAIAHEQLGLVYAARIELDETGMQIDGRRFQLVPGMAVSAEVMTGKRRVIEFFLSPVIKHSSESIRER